MKSKSKTEFGDFQTPIGLAREVCRLLVKLGEKPQHVIEPTVGRGAFLRAAAEAFPEARLNGCDINPAYIAEASTALEQLGASARSTLAVEDFFNYDWDTALSEQRGNLLILGNPPWVTNAGVAAVNGTNLPVKENFQGLRGIAARTGKANFDISEWMLIRLLQALEHRPATLAMLCKTATARKFLRYAWQNDGRIAHAALYRIEAATHFGAAVDACLLYLRIGSTGPREADVYPSLDALAPTLRIGLVGKEMVANLQAYRQLRHFEGLCPFQWRSGIKHDCAAIMELRQAVDGTLENGLGERLDMEPDFVFPLLKCSDLSNARITPKRSVIVTQRFVGDATSSIAQKAPRTWRYLQSHAERFLARKSSIYRAAVPFALFGIGPYAFTPWKVAVSGLHSSARFHAIPPVDGRPVFFDDTCYFLSFQSADEAQLVAEILNSSACQQFISCLVFTDAKRPITVDLLQRLDMSALASEAGLGLRWLQFTRGSFSMPSEPAQLALLMEEPPRSNRATAR